MTITRQKISGALRKGGVPSSKWSKGRVTWNASEGYDLMMFGFNGRAAEISYNVHTGFRGWAERNTQDRDAGLAKIEAALAAAGLQARRDGDKVMVLDAA